MKQLLDLAWLAGLFDGEGTITILKDSRRGYCVTRIGIQMTHKETIMRAAEIMRFYGCDGVSTSTIERKENHKVIYQVRTGRLLDLLRLCILLTKYSVTKKTQWEILKRFVDSRLKDATLLATGKVAGNKKCGQGAFEELLFQELKSANKKGR